ncbi:hypothetical protein B0T18DRAFT_15411 [Schizothecium vesticola]|uniref:Secreted protein n=1 Tax=Schizothecium vesticola TaxID=314040 RepID=A0AA40F931_9PEZI|nr:hypothetical protein B0T18DRAFT_15411 [Schizothecium vesticola]
MLSSLLLFPLARLPGPAADIATRPCTRLPSHSAMGKENGQSTRFPHPSRPAPDFLPGHPPQPSADPVVWSQPASSSINHRPCSHPCRRLVPRPI